MSKTIGIKASPHSKFFFRGSVVLTVTSVALISISVGCPTLKQRQDADRQAIANASAVQSQIIQAAKVRKTSELIDTESDIARDLERRIPFGSGFGNLYGGDFVEHGLYAIKKYESDATSDQSNSKAPEPYISMYDTSGKFIFGIYLLSEKNKTEQALAIND